MAAKTVSTNPKWKHLVNSYFDDVYLRYNPTAGTSAGLHQYDAKLEDCSHSSLDAQAAAPHQYEKKVVAFPTSSPDQPDQGDREFLPGNIRSQLLTLVTIRPWQKNPDTYSTGITNSAFIQQLTCSLTFSRIQQSH